MKKNILFYIMLILFSNKAISNNWDLEKNGINYNQAKLENLIELNNNINSTNLYIFDDFDNILKSGTTHGDFILGQMGKISNTDNFTKFDLPLGDFAQNIFVLDLFLDTIGFPNNLNESNIVNVSFKHNSILTIGTTYLQHKHNYLITTAANENAENDNLLCFNEKVICVAATNYSGQKTYYSGYGSSVDIAAPGGEKDTDRFKILKNLQQLFPKLNLVYDGLNLYEEVNGNYINIDETYLNKQYNKNAIKLANNQPALTKLVLAHAINKVFNNEKYIIGDNTTGDYNYNLENIPHIQFINAIKTISNLPNNPEPLYVGSYTSEGTSFSAPYVTITLANIIEKLSENSDLKDISREQVLDLLYMSGDYVASFDNYDTCQNINKVINIGEVTSGIYIQNNSLINNNIICEAAKIRIPRKINFYKSLYNASFVLPTTIKTTGEADILSNSTSLREFLEDGEIWGSYRKSNELDILEINHNLLIDEDLKAKNLTINQGVIAKFNYDIDVSVGNMFDNQGIIEGCFADTCSHIGSLEFTGKASYFKNEGSIDIDSGSAGIYQGGGELIVKDSCSASLKNTEGRIKVLYNENVCELKAKKITYKPTEFNISRHNFSNFNISGNHYQEDSIVVLEKSDSQFFNGYSTNYFDVFELILKDNLTITNKFSTHKLYAPTSNQKTIDISSIEGFNYDLNEWQLNNLFFENLNLNSTTLNTYILNNIYVNKFYLINSEINGNPSLFVNSFINISSTLNLSNLIIEKNENVNFELNNSGTINISDTLTLTNLGEINASDLVGLIYDINKLKVGSGTHLKIDVDLTVGDLELYDDSSVEILDNKTLNIENVTTTNQLNDINSNSLIYGDGFVGLNNFICTNNYVTDFGDINVSFYEVYFSSTKSSRWNCNIIANKVNFVSFKNNYNSTVASGTIKLGNATKNTDLYFNSNFNHNNIKFQLINDNANIYIDSIVNAIEFRLKNGKIYNNGELNIIDIYTNVGNFYEGNKINNTGLIRYQKNNILFEKEVEINRPYFLINSTISLGSNITFNNMSQDLNISSNNSKVLTIKGVCNKTINYPNGNVNLENIRLYNNRTSRPKSTPCRVNAETVNLLTFDPLYNQQDLYGNINNLNIYAQSTDDIQLDIIGNLNNYSNSLILTYASQIDGDINNSGDINTSSLTHLNGYINNNGTFKITTLKTNVLGNITGNEINVTRTSVQGFGDIYTLSSGVVENLSGSLNDIIHLNHDFTFINPQVYNFEGIGEATFEGLCSNHYKYENGILNLDNIKLKVHSPNSYYSRSYGCEITADEVNLYSYDTNYNNRNMIIHGNLNVLTSNIEDPYVLFIDNGNLFIDNEVTLNIESGSSIDTELLLINTGSKLFSTGGFRIYDTDVINDGIIEASHIYTSRIGNFSSDNQKINSYILEGNESGEITVESDVEVDYLRLSNTNDIIVLNYPLTINNTGSTLRFSGTEQVTIKGICRNQLYFEEGTIELLNIKLPIHAPNSYYTPSNGCLIEAKDTFLTSLDSEYNNRDLFITGNFTVFNSNSDIFKLNVKNGNLVIKENVELNLEGTINLDTQLIQVDQGAKLYSAGGLKSYNSDVINNGIIEVGSFETSRLGHFDTTNLFLLGTYTLSGYENGIITVESEGSVNNIRVANSNDKIIMNYPFTFNGTYSTLNFDGTEKVTISDLCKNEIFYETGVVDLVNVKLNSHILNPTYGHPATHGCSITANNVNLVSLNNEFDNRDLIINGELNVSSNSEDEIKVIVNGDVNINVDSYLNLKTYSEFNGLSFINNGTINVQTIVMPITDIINNGIFNIASLQTQRLGHIQGSGLFNAASYYIKDITTVNVESDSKVNNLIVSGGQLNVIMDFPFEFENLQANLTLSGTNEVTVSGLCNRKVLYPEGVINLEYIEISTSGCEINSSTINLNSFNQEYNQRVLNSIGNLKINGSYTNGNYLELKHSGMVTVNSNLNLLYSTNISDRLNILGQINFKLNSYSHNGTLLNQGSLNMDSGRSLIVNGSISGNGFYGIEECKFNLNGTIYESPNDLITCD